MQQEHLRWPVGGDIGREEEPNARDQRDTITPAREEDGREEGTRGLSGTGGRKPTEEDTTFKPPTSLHIQIGAHIRP